MRIPSSQTEKSDILFTYYLFFNLEKFRYPHHSGHIIIWYKMSDTIESTRECSAHSSTV